jgi:hypothetical protein
MAVTEASKMVERKRPPVVVCIIPLIIGVLGFSSLTQNPQFESYRTVHVVQLLGSGACIGAALASLIAWLTRPRA